MITHSNITDEPQESLQTQILGHNKTLDRQCVCVCIGHIDNQLATNHWDVCYRDESSFNTHPLIGSRPIVMLLIE